MSLLQLGILSLVASAEVIFPWQPSLKIFPPSVTPKPNAIVQSQKPAGIGQPEALSLAQQRDRAAREALAIHLRDMGAKFYGTYDCPYCHVQRQLFGPDAARYLDEMYVECHPKGKNPQLELCQQAGISVTPTWEINGRLYRGLRTLERLARLSGYQGEYNFRAFGATRD